MTKNQKKTNSTYHVQAIRLIKYIEQKRDGSFLSLFCVDILFLKINAGVSYWRVHMLKGNDSALVLSAARDLIADKKHWCTRVLHVTEEIKQISISLKFPFIKFQVKKIYKYCARGAVMKVLGEERPIEYASQQFWAIDNLLKKQIPNQLYDVGAFNNCMGHEAVLKMFDAAIKESQEQF